MVGDSCDYGTGTLLLTKQFLGRLNAQMLRPLTVKQKTTAIFLLLCSIIPASAADKPAPVPAGPAAGHDAADDAAAAVVAAIKALGPNPSSRQIGNIVFKAVGKSPASVLPIVHAAVLASPQAAAPEIVTAATAAVPDPWKKVAYHRITSRVVKKAAPDSKDAHDEKPALDRKPIAGAKGAVLPAVAEGPTSTITLAEAIIRTALDALPGLDLPTLQAAADIALLGDPSVLLRYIQGPRSISGVGDAGTSNYANEPFRPGVAGTKPVPTPQEPAVSK